VEKKVCDDNRCFVFYKTLYYFDIDHSQKTSITEQGRAKEINVEQRTASYGSKLMEELIGYMPKRTKELRQRCVDATPEVCVERARLITKAYEEYGSLPVTMKRAMSFEKILNTDFRTATVISLHH